MLSNKNTGTELLQAPGYALVKRRRKGAHVY